MLDSQLNWARKEYRWQVKVETSFPLPLELKPKYVCLKHRNVFDKQTEMIPDRPNKLTYWFFKTDSDCRAFMEYIINYQPEQRLCSKIGE